MNTARLVLLLCMLPGMMVGCRPISATGAAMPSGASPDTVVEADREPEVEAAITEVPTALPEAVATEDIDSDASTAVGEDEGNGESEFVESPGVDPALVAAGEQVYRENYCGVCHRLDAIGATGAFGPPHDTMGRVAWERIAAPSYRGTATDGAGYVLESIVDPYVYLVESYEVTAHRMPPYGHLAAEPLEALVAFLMAQE